MPYDANNGSKVGFDKLQMYSPDAKVNSHLNLSQQQVLEIQLTSFSIVDLGTLQSSNQCTRKLLS